MRQLESQDIRSREREFNVLLGATLRRRRKALGYSIDAVAAALDTTPQTISRYELGESSMSAARLASIARALNMGPALAVAEAGLRQAARGRDSDMGDFDVGLHAVIRDFLRLQTPASRRLACDAVRNIADAGSANGRPSQFDRRGNDQHF